jgi:hypothetical protein
MAFSLVLRSLIRTFAPQINRRLYARDKTKQDSALATEGT